MPTPIFKPSKIWLIIGGHKNNVPAIIFVFVTTLALGVETLNEGEAFNYTRRPGRVGSPPASKIEFLLD
jgi:hypothetical protein